MSGNLRLAARLLLTVVWVAMIFLPLYFTWQLRLSRVNGALMMFSFYVGCLLWGVRVKTQGMLARERPLLVISNHFSYLDVFALGSRIPARFTPKSEIASWPLIGFVTRVGGCIYINRRASQILHNKSELDYAVAHGDIISLFPESTTSEGTGLLRFKSSLFSIAEHRKVCVQPVTVAYTKLNGKPMDASARPIVGWYGDALFFPHVVTLLKQKSVDVTLIFHTPVSGDQFESRKELSTYCRSVIEQSLMQT